MNLLSVIRLLTFFTIGAEPNTQGINLAIQTSDFYHSIKSGLILSWSQSKELQFFSQFTCKPQF